MRATRVAYIWSAPEYSGRRFGACGVSVPIPPKKENGVLRGRRSPLSTPSGKIDHEGFAPARAWIIIDSGNCRWVSRVGETKQQEKSKDARCWAGGGGDYRRTVSLRSGGWDCRELELAAGAPGQLQTDATTGCRIGHLRVMMAQSPHREPDGGSAGTGPGRVCLRCCCPRRRCDGRAGRSCGQRRVAWCCVSVP